MRIRRVYEELLKQEKRQVLQLKCLSGAAAFIFVAGFFVVFLGLAVVRKIAKGFSYKGANCVVEGSVITGISESCTCGMHPCISQYPCLQVMVRVIDNRAEKSESSKLVLLYNNIYDLGSNCTYGPPCKTDEKQNIASVQEYERKRGRNGSVLECYFNPSKPEEVLVDVNAHETVAFHVFFWPCCGFVIGVCMMIRAWHLKKNQKKQVDFSNEVPSSVEWGFNNGSNGIYNCRKIKGGSALGTTITL